MSQITNDNYKSLKERIESSPYTYLFPALLFISIFIIYPILGSFYLSLTDWNGLTATKHFVGFSNYWQMFMQDPNYMQSLKNTLVFVLGFMGLSIVIGLVLALVLNENIKFSSLFKVLIYLPSVLPYVVSALTWRWMYDPSWGTVNQFLSLIGLKSLTHAWLGEASTSLYAIMLTAVWQQVPFVLIIYLAGLAGIPLEIINAAEVDGASYLQILFKVVLPMLKKVTLLVVVMTTIYGFKIFDLIYIMTRGGPGTSSEVMAHYMYFKAFQEFRMGYGSAIAVTLFLLILPGSIAYVSLATREDS